MSPSIPLRDALFAEVDRRARPVALRRDSLPASTGTNTFAGLWLADYALVLLWPLSADTAERLNAGLAEARAHLESLLVEAERDERGTLDGYLVAALDRPPSSTLATEIQRQELSPLVCRTHVVWPEAGNWPRLARLAVLGPSSVPAAGAAATLPTDLDAAELALLDQLETHSARAVADDIKRRAGVS